MEYNNADLQDEISRAISRENRAARRSWLIAIVCFLIGALWIAYSFNQVRRLNDKTRLLEANMSRLNEEIRKKEEEKKAVEDSLQQIRGIVNSFKNLTGKRKQAVDLALNLKEDGYGFVPGGRKREDGGFDMSGFIDYILKETGVMKPVDVPNCNLACLKSYPGVTRVASRSELKPGDLIFYRPDWNQTMLYLGGNIAIGMMWKGKIEVREINFGPDPVYAKVAYPDEKS
ncbi:MAG: NlpC/P60 family protein [Acidobacteriota bacterium]